MGNPIAYFFEIIKSGSTVVILYFSLFWICAVTAFGKRRLHIKIICCGLSF